MTCAGLTALTFACSDVQTSADSDSTKDDELNANSAAAATEDDPAITALMNSVWEKNGASEYLPWDYAPDGG